MPSCTCLRTPSKYVTEPQKRKGLESDRSSAHDVQSIVTDSEAFDDLLLKHEASTSYEDTSDAESASSTSSRDSLEEAKEQAPRRRDQAQDSARSNTSLGSYGSSRKTESEANTTPRQENEQEQTEEEQEATKQPAFPKKLRETVERWNELLKEFDDEPDVIEVKKALTIVSMLSENQDPETVKQVQETIRRLTTSLAELRSESGATDSELVVQPYLGDDEETYFRCFVRRLRDHTGNTEVELAVNEVVAENIQVLLNSLGLSRRTLRVDRGNFLTRMSSGIKGSTVFKNLMETPKQPMDLTTYLHQLSNQVENDDLASVSTLSEVDMNYSEDAFSNCIINTSHLLDNAICNPLKRCNKQIPAFVSREMEKQARLKNKYQDMSDLPLFIS